MVQVEINDTQVVVRSGTAAKTGRPYEIRSQAGWAHLYDRNGNKHPHPTRIEINLEKDQAAYEPGTYTLHPQSLYVDRFNTLRLGNVVLSKATPQQLKSAA